MVKPSRFFSQKKPGGAAFFSRNIKKLPQTLKLIRDVQALALRESHFLSLLMKGANVVRLQKYAMVIPSNMAIGATKSDSLSRQVRWEKIYTLWGSI